MLDLLPHVVAAAVLLTGLSAGLRLFGWTAR